MGKNNMKGQIISAFIGATFFAVPYLGMGISVLPSLGIGAIAYGAGTLMEKQDLLCRITDLQALETPKEKSNKGQSLN